MEPRKILIVRLGALGDVIHAVPAQQVLRRRFPQAEIHWLTEPPYKPLLEGIEGLHKVWTADTKRWRKRPFSLQNMRGLLRRLRRESFDLAVDFQGLLKSAALARLARPAELIGFRGERFKEGAAAWFYSRSAAGEADLSRHVIDTNLHLTSLVSGSDGGGDEEASPYLPLTLPEDDVRYVDQQLEAADIDQPPVLLNPGAGWETKLWPARHMARLGRAIEDYLNLPVIYTWGPGEESLIEEIGREIGPERVRTFPTTILQLAALCRRSCLFVGGDTGPLHLAAGLGVPVVAVMGPTTATRNGPFDPSDEVVQRRLHCSDCYKRTCQVYFCMNIPHWEVLRAVVRRLRRTGWSPPPGGQDGPRRRSPACAESGTRGVQDGRSTSCIRATAGLSAPNPAGRDFVQARHLGRYLLSSGLLPPGATSGPPGGAAACLDILPPARAASGAREPAEGPSRA
ncbi:MAG TPA: glycosyltransferase family 9 protein, partial [Acidobacteriota bacterium]|nr:glycosyltransferase family 9 protein [Acidobacteriota bacterium]